MDKSEEILKMLGSFDSRLQAIEKVSQDTNELVRANGIGLAKQGEQIKDAFRQIRERVTNDKHDALERRVDEVCQDLDKKASAKKVEEISEQRNKIMLAVILAIITGAIGIGFSLISSLFGHQS